MLNVFYGREDTDKDKFLFDSIAGQLKADTKIILLVPDQFTLQAEQNAFDYLHVQGLMDLEIFSISRLGFRILEETGGGKRSHINKYGRHMLLTKIMAEEEKNLRVFNGVSCGHSFIDMLNNFISEMKQYDTGADALSSVLETVDKASLLFGKITDIQKIYSKYEKQIEGKYVDTEDYINLVVSKLKEATFIKKAYVWVVGFDYFAPKNLDVLEELMVYAKDVNLILTSSENSRDGSLFQITKDMIERLTVRASRRSVNVSVNKIVDGRAKKKDPMLAHLEKELYSYPHIEYLKKGFMGESATDGAVDLGQAIQFCAAANIYSEAESAAKFIIDLVNEHNYRYKDILVILNDMEGRASVVKRVFEEYNISFFLDKKRDVSHNPVINLIEGLMDLILYGWNYQTIFRIYKTDLFPIGYNEILDFENYVIKYNILGGKWKKDFILGKGDWGEEGLAEFNEIRKKTVDLLGKFEKSFNAAKNTKEKTEVLFDFLNDEIEIPGKISELMDYMYDEDKKESALEAAQIWNVVVEIFNQIVILLEEEPISSKDYARLLDVGMKDIEIGLLPPTMNEVLVGTMQRTRGGDIKALVVMGANDGLLPSTIVQEGLFNEDEKIKILNGGNEICKMDELRIKEESLAIYKALSKPTEYLYMSYSVTDIDGRESKPSIIFEKLRNIFAEIPVSKDILNTGEPLDLINTPVSTAKHLSKALMEVGEGQALDETWLITKDWYFEDEKKRKVINPMMRGLLFTNGEKKIEASLAEMLYNKKNFSPSQLERFAKCPFSYFLNFGLKPEERKVFEVAGREIGDIYHEAIRQSLENKVDFEKIENEEQCYFYVSNIMDKQAEEYKEGILKQGVSENYKLGRLKKVCSQAVWALLNQLRHGEIDKMFFESKFGSYGNAEFPPIKINISGNNYTVEGKIDRVDFLDEDYVKIIDYKSGKEKFDLNEVRAGVRLQLMIYLQAAMGEKNKKPAGVFYFEIGENLLDMGAIPTEKVEEKLRNELEKSYKLDGIVINEPNIIEKIAGEFDSYSTILPIKKNKEGLYVGTTAEKILTAEEFEVFQREVREKVKEIIKDITEGCIDVRPKKTKNSSACIFCQYKSICNFDLSFDGCSFDMIK